MAVGIVAFIAVTFYFSNTPAPTRNGQKLIEPDKTNVHWVRHKDEVDGTLSILHKPSGDTFTTDFYDKNHYELPNQAESSIWERHLSRDQYIFDPGLDLGAYAAYKPDGDREFEVGLRVSPVRCFFGTTAPDLLIGERSAGVGISLFPPKGSFGSAWDHLGVGFGRTWDYKGGGSDNMFYLGFSTRY